MPEMSQDFSVMRIRPKSTDRRGAYLPFQPLEATQNRPPREPVLRNLQEEFNDKIL